MIRLARENPPENVTFLRSGLRRRHLARRGQAPLLAPGGRLAIVGLANNWTARVCMPMEDSTMSWSEERQAAHRLLPGCRFRRRLLWRYTLVWDKPREGGP
jgi:hypothetical protein